MEDRDMKTAKQFRESKGVSVPEWNDIIDKIISEYAEYYKSNVAQEECEHPEHARSHYARDLYRCEVCGYDGW